MCFQSTKQEISALGCVSSEQLPTGHCRSIQLYFSTLDKNLYGIDVLVRESVLSSVALLVLAR